MLGLRHFVRCGCVAIAISLTAISLTSCSLAKNQMAMDRGIDKTFQEYRDAMAAPAKTPDVRDLGAPDFQPIMATPADLKLPSPLVTVSVNQTVALSDLMFELAEQSGVDIELDPQIRGSIIFTAKERPFNEVVERICEMAGLRYTFQNNILRVELDRPYVKNYKVDYLNIGRKSSSEIRTDLSGTSGEDGVTSGMSATSEISNSFTSNLWKEIGDGLKEILAASDTYLPLATMSNPVAMPVPVPLPMPAVGPDGAVVTPPPLPGASPVAVPGMVDPNTVAGVDPTVPPTLNITQESDLPAQPNAPATYSVSRETGVISVFASERQQKMVKQFLDDFRRVATLQVLIEARVLEVSLKDEFSGGVDWGTFDVTGHAFAVSSFPGQVLTPAAPTGNIFTLNLDIGNAKPVISALSRYGTVRALSSPRVTVMNSQPAVVNVTNNTVYFDIVTTQTPSTAVGVPPTITSTATIKTAPEGVMMNVLPIVNPDTGEIQLAVRPSVSKITRQVADPVNVGNTVPEMMVQQIDSVVKIQSGQTIVMGGLMRDTSTAQRLGVPVLNEVPVIGGLFRNQVDSVQKTELVILLRASVVQGSPADEVDRKLYNVFGKDRRPLPL